MESFFIASDTGKKCNLLDFTDSNWCGDKVDKQSTTEYIFMFNETPISWCSKKEPIVTLSSCEVEYIVALMCMCQVVWLMNLLKELDNDEGDVVTLMVDNVSAIIFSKNSIAHGRRKHIEMRFHYLIELISEGRLRLEYCGSEDLVANFLTNRVTIKVFKRLKMNMNMEDLEHLN